jgi:hypothetical protein
MRSKLITALTVIGAVTVLVLAANTVALATTGKALIAGKTNTSTKPTAIKRTIPGPVLVLKSKRAVDAPLAVNGKGRVANLNADTVDGKDSSLLGTRALVWTYSGSADPSIADRTWTMKDVPAGTYLFNYEISLGLLSIDPGEALGCRLMRLNQFVGGETISIADANQGAAANGTALMTLPAKSDIALKCKTTDASNWAIGLNTPVRVTAVPITGLTNKGAPPVS